MDLNMNMLAHAYGLRAVEGDVRVRREYSNDHKISFRVSAGATSHDNTMDGEELILHYINARLGRRHRQSDTNITIDRERILDGISKFNINSVVETLVSVPRLRQMSYVGIDYTIFNNKLYSYQQAERELSSRIMGLQRLL